MSTRSAVKFSRSVVKTATLGACRVCVAGFGWVRTLAAVSGILDEPEGWCLDPYGHHEQRWFSAGRPTALVRDAVRESRDPPPDAPPPRPVEAAPEAETPTERADPYDPDTARDHIFRAAMWGDIGQD